MNIYNPIPPRDFLAMEVGCVVVERDAVPETYHGMLASESHHKHPIVQDAQGTLRWMANPNVRADLERITLHKLIPLLHALGYDKNSEVYRHLYRTMGCSLSVYWETFYWEPNNPALHEYVQPVSGYLVIPEDVPQGQLEGFFTQSEQLARGVRKDGGSNCFHADGTESVLARAFCDAYSDGRDCKIIHITTKE